MTTESTPANEDTFHLTKIPLTSDIPGTLYRSAMPDITDVPNLGVQNIVMLLYYGKELNAAYEAHGIKVIHFPIEDMCCPYLCDTRPVIEQIKTLLRNGESVLIHCYGGMGRTGTIMACVVGDLLGMKSKEAIEYLRQFYYAVETSDQIELVTDYLDVPKYSKDYTMIPLLNAGKIYRSPMPFSLDAIADMKEKDITTVMVLSSTDECIVASGFNLKSEYKKAGLTVISLSIRSSNMFTPGFQDTRLIENARKAIAEAKEVLLKNENILVHCFDGINRTGALITCLVGEISHWSVKASLNYVRQYFPAAMTAPDRYWSRKQDMMDFLHKILVAYEPPRLNKDLMRDIVKKSADRERSRPAEYKIVNSRYFCDQMDYYCAYWTSTIENVKQQ